MSHTREEFMAQFEADEAAMRTTEEYRTITRRLDALYASQMAGDSTVYTRQRIARLEALQQAFMGQPEAMAA